jgi:hypothetical protein
VPSIRADSSSSIGISLKKLAKIQIVRGSPCVVYGRINPSNVFSGLKSLSKIYSGLRMDMAGNIDTDSTSIRMRFFPLKFSRAPHRPQCTEHDAVYRGGGRDDQAVFQIDCERMLRKRGNIATEIYGRRKPIRRHFIQLVRCLKRCNDLPKERKHEMTKIQTAA